MKPGDKLELIAGDLAYGAAAVCRGPDGMVVFVPGLAPGDRALVVIERVRSNHANGRTLEIRAPGPDRVTAPCPAYGTCGGCQWMHVSLAAQRSARERIVGRFLEGFMAVNPLGPIRFAGDGWAYRNRLILPVRAGSGGFRAGFYRAGSHDIVGIESCAVQRPELWEAARTALELLRSAGASGYDEGTGAGRLRHLYIRLGAGTGELGVVLVTTDTEFPQSTAFARELMNRLPKVVGVLRNVNAARTNVILGPRTSTLAGRGWIAEEIGGLRFRASLPAFFQANAEVTALLVDQIRKWTASGARGGGVLDLYCGVGILGISAAAAAGAERLAGVEESDSAVADAEANAALIPGTKSSFEAGCVEDVLPRMPDSGRFDTVIADPPRKGLVPDAMKAVLRLPARRFICVSCDPATLARDLKLLVAGGWKVREAVPFDMFPQTYHVETAVLLER